MRTLNLETLQAIVASKTATVVFPQLDFEVTVRAMQAADAKRVQEAIGSAADTPEANKNAELLAASICIGNGEFDSDEGRQKLSELARPVIAKIAEAIMGLTGADGVAKKN